MSELSYKQEAELRGALWEAQREFRRRGQFLKAWRLRQLLEDPRKWRQAVNRISREPGLAEIGDGKILERILQWLFEEGGLQLIIDLIIGGLT